MLVRFKAAAWDLDEYGVDDWQLVPAEDFSDGGEYLFRAEDFRGAESGDAPDIAAVTYVAYDVVRTVVVRASMNEIAEKIGQALERR